jgi:hypothetical protein
MKERLSHRTMPRTRSHPGPRARANAWSSSLSNTERLQSRPFCSNSNSALSRPTRSSRRLWMRACAGTHHQMDWVRARLGSWLGFRLHHASHIRGVYFTHSMQGPFVRGTGRGDGCRIIGLTSNEEGALHVLLDWPIGRLLGILLISSPIRTHHSRHHRH